MRKACAVPRCGCAPWRLLADLLVYLNPLGIGPVPFAYCPWCGKKLESTAGGKKGV